LAGAEVTRLEGFTDAVFAFAVTLLVVSLEVPKTFPELMVAMHGFLAFGVCFALLANVWYQHYRFFRRYALENPWVVFLNCALLFFVLFYIYPLKFLFTAMFNGSEISASEVRALFTIWSLGYAAVFAIFALLYLYAWRVRAQLELTPLEAIRTQVSLLDQIAMVVIGLLATALARTVPDRYVGIVGPIYFLGPISRQVPGASPSMLTLPMAARIRRRVGNPTFAVMRRTWRFFPSRIVSLIHAVGIFAR
jgi:uncharacterized membrane protein